MASFTRLRKRKCHAVTISENAPFREINEFLLAQPGHYMIEDWLTRVCYYFTEADVAFEFKLRFA